MHPAYVFGEIIDAAAAKDAPPDVGGDYTPRHAWRMGYLQALEDCARAFGVLPDKSVAPQEPSQ